MLVTTDARSRVVLPGHPDQQYLMRENDDGSLLLEPAIVLTAAQYDYDRSEAQQQILTRATESPTVRRTRKRLPE